MTNLIQNYANNIGQGISSVNNTTKKYYTNLTDVNSENLLQPLDGKGYLVENSLATAPKEFAKDTYYTAKSLSKGIAGKANDHELGKLNDLGLKLGGLSIAAYLMTKRQTPKMKAMEFVGFGAFLASMAIWPKVALQWPAQLVHGFNFRKQYVDEQGRKKYLTQDPNYIPFDLMKGKRKSEDLGHIADRMGIPKDEKDRNELAKEHIRKVSVQNNTLWMLTAGVATPVMTALACNRIEGPLGKLTEKISNNKVNKMIDKIADYQNGDAKAEAEVIDMKPYEASEKKLSALLKSKTGQALSERDIDDINNLLTEGFDGQTQKTAKMDLQAMMKADKTVINNDAVSEISDAITKKLDSKYGEGYTASVFDTKKLSEHVNNFMNQNGNPKNGVLTPDKADELRISLGQLVQDTLDGNKSIREARKEVITDMASDAINDVFGKKKAAILTEDAAGQISKAGHILRKFRAYDKTISSAAHFKVENAPETIVANNWSDVTKTLIKELKISPKELNEAKSSEELTAQLFTRKLENIAKDENKYKKFVSNIAEKMALLDEKLDNPREGKRNAMDVLTDGIVRNCDGTSNELNSLPFQNLAERIKGRPVDGSFIGGIKDAKLNRLKGDRLDSVKSSYMRLLHTADFFRRAEEYNNGKGGFSGNEKLDKALIEKGKKVLMSDHSGEFYLKHETANNVSFYKALIWHTFGSGDMSDKTKEALGKQTHEVFNSGKTSMAERVTKWAKHVGNLMGKNVYDFLPNHTEGNDSAFTRAQKTAVAKFNKIACTPDNMLYKALKDHYNTNKWLKMCTTAGSIVLGVTLASQFAFGKQDKVTK